MLADHILGTRKTLRALRDARDHQGLSARDLYWHQGYIWGRECQLRDLRNLAAVMRGRP